MSKYLITRHINEILKYADFHFQSEENIMLLYDYPESKSHQELHKDLLDEVGSTLYYFEKGEKSISQITEILISWFLEHTTKEDIKFGEYINKKGVSIPNETPLDL
jgi:hemerythrin